MHNLCGMARMLLNGESRLLTVCAVNGLGVAEKSRDNPDARSPVMAFQRVRPNCRKSPRHRPLDAPRCCWSLSLLIRLHGSIHSKRLPTPQGGCWHSHSSNKFNAAPAASFNLEGSVRSGAKSSRALCRGGRPHRSRVERAAATPEQRARFKAYDLRRSPGSNACTTFAVWHGCCSLGKVGC